MFISVVVIELSVTYLNTGPEDRPQNIHNKHNSFILMKLRYLIEKINFFYSVVKTFRVIIFIMDFDKTEPTCYRTNFPYVTSG